MSVEISNKVNEGKKKSRQAPLGEQVRNLRLPNGKKATSDRRLLKHESGRKSNLW